MPLPRSDKATNEHLIFVKNVPGYLATDEIRSLFAKYNPASLKNVYPNSNVTTVVIGFRTNEEAVRAQAGTDQTRLAHVILKVEMYNQRQSVRYLRDQGQTTRPRGAEHDEEEPGYFDEEPTQEDSPVLTPPLEPHTARGSTSAPQGTTWAEIAGNRRALVEEAPTTPEVDSSATTESTPISTPRMPVPVPQKLSAPGLEQKSSPIPPPAAVSLGNSTPEALAIPSPHIVDDTKTPYTDQIEERVRRLGDITSWDSVAQWAYENSSQQSAQLLAEPFDTTARIQKRHCQNCAFCQLRDRF